MNRRNVLKTLGISAAGLATVPLWVDAWTVKKLPAAGLNINDDQNMMLAELVGTIIPATDTPGAKELEVNKFILTMVEHCFEKDIQDEFLAGFDELEEAIRAQHGKSFMGIEFGKSYVELSDIQRNEILARLAAIPVPPEKKINFISFVKGLTITGFMSSEYVLENIIKYELIPSRFNGSFPVNQSIYKNA